MSVSCVEGYLVEQSKDDLEHHWLSDACEDQHVAFFQPNPLIQIDTYNYQLVSELSKDDSHYIIKEGQH